MTFLKNKKHYVYASMAIAIALSMMLVGTKAKVRFIPITFMFIVNQIQIPPILMLTRGLACHLSRIK